MVLASQAQSSKTKAPDWDSSFTAPPWQHAIIHSERSCFGLIAGLWQLAFELYPGLSHCTCPLQLCDPYNSFQRVFFARTTATIKTSQLAVATTRKPHSCVCMYVDTQGTCCATTVCVPRSAGNYGVNVACRQGWCGKFKIAQKPRELFQVRCQSAYSGHMICNTRYRVVFLASCGFCFWGFEQAGGNPKAITGLRAITANCARSTNLAPHPATRSCCVGGFIKCGH